MATNYIPKDFLIVYNFDSTISLRSINALNKILKKEIIMFRHGSLEMLITNSNGKGLIYKIENQLTKKFFFNQNLKISKHLHFFVLGDIILKNLSNLLTQDKLKQFHSIDHPYGFDKDLTFASIKKSNKLNLGTIGVFNEHKGGGLLIKLAQIFKTQGYNDIAFSITGKIDTEIEKLLELGIEIPINRGNEMISIEEMKQRINKLNFILFFYNSETYKLTASGALFEAINMRKPIIALRNDYFEYIFSKFGKIGYLVDSVDEMATLIERIYLNNEKQISIDFENIQNMLSTDISTQIFKSKLQNLQFLK